jgi:uncharacterized OsmC-like protein
MRVSATIRNDREMHEALVSTEGASRHIHIPRKIEGRGSAVNGAELLFLALATCYGNDVYREAAAAGIPIDAIEVTVDGEFGGPGEPGRNLVYSVTVSSPADAALVHELLRHTDTVAEIQNTVRVGTPVVLGALEVLPPAG